MRLALFRENVRIGLSILAERKFRSFLTIVGVLIGVLIIVGVASVLNGFRASVISQIEEFGTSNIYIYRFPFLHIGRRDRSLRNRKELTLADAWAIRDTCPSVRIVSPGLQAPGSQSAARYRGREIEAPLFRGNFPQALEVSNSEIEEGRVFTPAENESATRVAVIGSNVRDALFPNETPIGKRISVGGGSYIVIGLLAKHREGPFGEQNHEDSIISIPYHAFQKRFPWLDDHFIAAQAHTGKLDQAIDEIEEVLRRRRKVKWDEPNDFEIGTADSIIQSFDSIVFAVLAGMFSLSTVAFLVGGVGVMNIMLASVKERTREIGVRRAVGARRRDIALQFLVEAAVLTALGGVLGVVAGEALIAAIREFVPALPAVTPMWARVFGFVGSTAVGLVFGFWPAVKAARLDPIEALRYE